MDTISETLYTTEVTSTGGRRGRATSADGVLDLTLAPPKDGGGPGGATNPEQLFAAGYAACFHSALLQTARHAGVEVADSTVTAQVRLGRDSGGGYTLAVELTAGLPGVAGETARQLVEQAHQVCPYSRATRGNIEVTVDVG